MGYSIPLALFKTNNGGMKLYTDANCTIEEMYNTLDPLKPFYELRVNNVRRGNEKQIKRYVKNVGINPTLYYIYLTSPHNMKYYFVDSQGNKREAITGLCNAGLSRELNLVIESEYNDFESSFELHILTRDISS